MYSEDPISPSVNDSPIFDIPLIVSRPLPCVFFLVKGILLMANKYEKHVVRNLEQDWPQTLCEWDKLK